MKTRFLYGIVLAGVALVVAFWLIGFHPVTWKDAPQGDEAMNYTIPIGITTQDGPGNYRALLEHYIKPEVKSLCEQMGAPFTFEFILLENRWTDALTAEEMGSNDSQTLLARARAADEIAYNISQELIDLGVKAVIGHPSNYQNVRCYQLMRDAGMTQISTNDDGEINQIEGDHLFRLVPYLSKGYVVTAKMMLSKGFDKCIIVGLDLWGTFDVFEEEYVSGGGEILRWMGKYGERALHEPDDLPEVIEALEKEAGNATERYGSDRVAVMLLYYSNYNLVREAAQQPYLGELGWFGGVFSAKNEKMLSEAGSEAMKLNLVCPCLDVHCSDATSPILDWYSEEFNESMSHMMASTYDASIIMVQAIIEANGTDSLLLCEAIPRIAESYVGLTGRCALNEYGDKIISDYELWGYSVELGVSQFEYLGRYDSVEDEITWEG